jgi:hypothetical protein
MQVQDDILIIRSDNLTDSIYDIKNAFEESSICRVRKIFAACCNDDPAEHALNSKPNKKFFYIWVEWTNTNASHMFTARLTHQGEHALFKQDRWGQPIVTERDEYGNPTEHAHWIVRRSSRFAVLEVEHYYLGDRENEEIWQTYLAEGESVEDTDDEEEEEDENDDKKDDEEPEEQQEAGTYMFPPMPQLKRANAVTAEEIHADQILSLEVPWVDVEDEEECELPRNNEAELKKIFNFHESALVFPEPSADALTRKELGQLSRGTLPLQR